MAVRYHVSYSFGEETLQTIKRKMLNWLRPFSIFAYLDNNNYKHGPSRFELLAGAGATASFGRVDEGDGDWLLGHIAYDYKNTIEPKLSSSHDNKTGFSESFFFCPETVVYIPAGRQELHIDTVHAGAEEILEQVLSMPDKVANTLPDSGPVDWQYRFSREAYLDSIAHIRQHIENGDCYELNFCTEAFAEAKSIDPMSAFDRLNTVNPSPFAALYRTHDSWLMCASPERFLYREKDEVLSQPIKGTARRGNEPEADGLLKEALYHDAKERAENVMIVDLVRNDLARSCTAGTITVPELFGVYTFPQVHQLISTVKGKIRPGAGNQAVIEHAFPMGSMTGAPKVMVMELIEKYERSRRGLYAGTVGYVTPEGDFDFNVVIRSLLYNQNNRYLSYQTGGAITYASDAAAEWEEVRLKAKAMEQIFL
jgi:para-aminobenzoate synthetase component 1